MPPLRRGIWRGDRLSSIAILGDCGRGGGSVDRPVENHFIGGVLFSLRHLNDLDSPKNEYWMEHGTHGIQQTD